jgi:hypothetical protein
MARLGQQGARFGYNFLLGSGETQKDSAVSRNPGCTCYAKVGRQMTWGRAKDSGAAFEHRLRGLDQPLQGVLAILESRKFPPRKALQGFAILLWEAFCAYPCCLFDVWLVEDGGFLHSTEGLLVEPCLGKVREHQERTAGMGGHNFGKGADGLSDLSGGRGGQVNQENPFPLKGDELDTRKGHALGFSPSPES